MMAMDTRTLIDQLAADAAPVRPLPAPWVRTLAWIALSVGYLAIVVFLMSPRADLVAKLSEWRFAIELSAALATGVTAAMVAFLSVIPGTDRRILLLPLVPLAVWLASVGHGCVSEWMTPGSHGLALPPSWMCVRGTLLASALPAVAIAIMLRRGAPLMPVATAALGALGAAGLGHVGLRLFHTQDSSIMILVWQLGSIFLLTVLAGLVGRHIFCWHARIRQGCPRAVLQQVARS
jgi:hypothetical protein